MLGLALTAWVLGALFVGPDDGSNGVLQAVYILVWVGLVPLALLAGHVWRDLSPWRTVQAVIGRATGRPDGLLTYPARLGHWPAALGLLAFVWLELASPDPGSITAMRWWVAIYMGVTTTGGVAFGPSWVDWADPFDVYSALVARMSPIARGGRLSRNPLRGLTTIPVAPGMVAVLAILLGSTAFDSFSASQTWQSRAPDSGATALALAGWVIVLSGPDDEDRIDVGPLGPGGLTALISALRRSRPGRERHRRAVDERFEVDHGAIARYRRWRTKWRVIGVVATVAAFFAAGASFSGGSDTVGSMLVATALLVPLYVVSSVAQQVVRRPSGPVPLAVRVTDARIGIERDGAPAGERHLWSDLAGVEISADLQQEGVLRLVPPADEPVEYSLTDRVGGDFRHEVLTELDELGDALIDAGEQHGVPVVELQR